MADNQSGDSLYVSLIQLRGDSLIVPKNAVVEVLGRDRLRPDKSQGPSWLLGRLDWHGHMIPAIDFDLLCGRSEERDNRRSRMVVMHAMSSHLASTAYAIACEGQPRMLPINAAALRPCPLEDDESAGFLITRTHLATQRPAIPDLERLEIEIAEAMA